MTKTVLVTGATGLIGSEAARALRSIGFDVIGTARRPSAGHEFRCLPADLLDQTQARAILERVKPDCVLHCAWDVTPGRFWSAPENADWAAATIGLGRAAAHVGVRRFVALGSAAEYASPGADDSPRRETHAIAPATFYGVSKDAARAVLGGLCKREGMSFAWGRVFDVFGPREARSRLIASLFDHLRAGTPFVCKHGQLVRDYSAAEDVGFAAAALTGSGVEGPVNIASGRSVSLGDLALRIAKRLGRPDLLTVLQEPAPSVPLFLRADVTRLRQEVGVPEPPDILWHLFQAQAEVRQRR